MTWKKMCKKWSEYLMGGIKTESIHLIQIENTERFSNLTAADDQVQLIETFILLAILVCYSCNYKISFNIRK